MTEPTYDRQGRLLALAGAISGADLAKEREAAGLSKAEVARRMGVKPQRLGHIEEKRRDGKVYPTYPTPATIARYRAALETK